MLDLSTPHPSMSSAQLHPYPPPSLAGVPMEYVIDQLRYLASHYWERQDTADCTIIVPLPHSSFTHLCLLRQHSFPVMFHHSGLGRRATQPALNFTPQISFNLHVDYLSAHSSYIRGLLSGASPLDLIQATSMSNSFKVPANRLPRLIPGPSNHPILFLPVPDPTSFHLLVHWIYFGDTSFINDSLHKGVIQWEGIARNVEYLGLSADLKVFLRNWYNCWLDPERAGSDFDDNHNACGDPNANNDHSSAMDDSDVDEIEVSRGRSRAIRPISYQDPQVQTVPP